MQCFSNRRKFAQLVGSNFNRIINHCCFFIPKYSCQVSRPWVTYPFWALATPIKAQKISATSTFLSTIVREKPDEYNVHFKGVSLLPLTLPEAELAHCALDGHWIVGSSLTSALAQEPQVCLALLSGGTHTTVWEPWANTPPSANQADAELRDHPTVPRDMSAH